MITLNTRIAGIPCKAVLEYCPPLSGTLDQMAEPEGFKLLEIQDRRGRRADWLSVKMQDWDYTRIMAQAFADLRGNREDEIYEQYKEKRLCR